MRWFNAFHLRKIVKVWSFKKSKIRDKNLLSRGDDLISLSFHHKFASFHHITMLTLSLIRNTCFFIVFDSDIVQYSRGNLLLPLDKAYEVIEEN